MLNWLLSLFQPSVDSILIDFNRTINKLDKAMEFHISSAANSQDVIDAATEDREFSLKEAERARSIAAKLEDLLK